MTMFDDQLIAHNRFGLGARADQIVWPNVSTNQLSRKQLQQQLLDELARQPAVSFPSWLPTSNKIGKSYADFSKKKKMFKNEAKKANKGKAASKQQIAEQEKKLQQIQKSYKGKQTFFQQTGYVLKQSIKSEQSLNWRLLDFFSNHFSVSAEGGLMKVLAVTLETEAIAPNLNGSFQDMLIAVSQHPAMLMYLNNEKSFGPNSTMAINREKKREKQRAKNGTSKAKKLGLNENLAREILELHTLGVNGGYKQKDVTELAKAITGWSLTNPRKVDELTYLYRHEGHEPGSRTVLGKRYPAGKEQGLKILKDLANHPSTADYVSRKLVQHFVNDKPNEELVKQLNHTWLATKGDLKAIMATLINSQHAWQTERNKFKNPREFLVSTLRLIDSTQVSKLTKAKSHVDKLKDKQLISWLTQMGQRPFAAGSPAGYPDSESDWNGANALMSRIDWVNLVVSKVRVDIDKAITLVFGDDKNSDNYLRIVRAESKQQALTMLLLSPEFMRR